MTNAISWRGDRLPAAKWFVDALSTGSFDEHALFTDARFATRAPCCPWAVGTFEDLVRWEDVLRAAFPGAESVVRVRVGHDFVRVCRVLRARHTGPFLGIAPGGRSVAFGIGYRAGVVAGLLVDAEMDVDLRGLLRQLSAKGTTEPRPRCSTSRRSRSMGG